MFYLVCAWYSYYPESGLGNIQFATTNYMVAKEMLLRLETENKYDYYELYESTELNWIDDVVSL